VMTHHQIEPGSAGGFKKKHGDPWESCDWSAEEKFDGHRGLLHLGCDLDRAYLTGRRPTKESNGLLSEKAENVPHLWQTAQDQADLHDIGYTVFDGEILVEGTDIVGPGSSKVQSVMGTSPEKALLRFKEGIVATYVIFDILFWNGEDIRSKPLSERRKLALEAALKLGLVNPRAPYATARALGMYARLAGVAHKEHGLKRFYDAIVNAGGEGLILKRDAAAYGEDWIKVKKEYTVDVIIWGFSEAEATSVKKGETEATATKYAGQIGAVEFGVYLPDGVTKVRIGEASGMDDAKRLDFSNNREKYIGRAIEVKANEFTGKALRHPRFIQFRDDLNPTDCTLEKLKRDMKWAESEKNPE
jgi:bifunctional non-homologous end joining protein LigD